MSNPGGFPAGPGASIPATTPPIGIAMGIGIGITSIDIGGRWAIEWLLGTLYAKKDDGKQLRAAARAAGITNPVKIKEFGDWLEWDVKPDDSRGPADHYTYEELVELAKKWLELYG